MEAAIKGIRISSDYIARRAGRYKQRVTSIPCKDNSTINILSNDNSFDVLQTSDGKLVGLCSYRMPKEYIIKKIQKMAADGIDVAKELAKTLTLGINK